MVAGDLGVLRVDSHAPARQPVQRPRAAVRDHHRKAPKDQPRITGSDRARHPHKPGHELPDQVVDEVLALRPSAQRHDEECRAPDLENQVAADEQPSTTAERVPDRDRREQAGEHQPDEHPAHRRAVRVEPVRAPGSHVPRVEDRERQDRRLGSGTQIYMRCHRESCPIAKT